MCVCVCVDEYLMQTLTDAIMQMYLTGAAFTTLLQGLNSLSAFFFFNYIVGNRMCEDTLLPRWQISFWACVLQRGHLLNLNGLFEDFVHLSRILQLALRLLVVPGQVNQTTKQPTNQTNRIKFKESKSEGTILTSICMCAHTIHSHQKHMRS